MRGAPGWPSQLSVQLLISAQVMISWFMGSGLAWGSVLTVWSLRGTFLSLSLSKITVKKLKKDIFSMFIFERQKKSISRGEAERERET